MSKRKKPATTYAEARDAWAGNVDELCQKCLTLTGNVQKLRMRSQAADDRETTDALTKIQKDVFALSNFAMSFAQQLRAFEPSDDDADNDTNANDVPDIAGTTTGSSIFSRRTG